jgi:predicted ATPase
MIFEDAHWADPTSLEAFGRTVDRIKTLPVLLIVTFRSEFNAPWAGRSHVTSLALNRLGERETAAIIAHLVGNKELPADVMAEIVERTDGIPLFAEEITKAVMEAGSEDPAQRTVAAIPSPTLAVPASLQASLMARLDRLGSAKEVAQIGAAVGREFSHALLSAVVGKPEQQLASALDRLIAAGLLFRQGVPPHASYLFKHALVQDVAYDTLLREPRRALHARIAEALESQFPKIAERQPEVLAHHCAKAGQTEKASLLLGRAGQQSFARWAMREAAEQLSRALGQIATLPGTAALRREQIKLKVALANALAHLKGYAAPETRTSLDQARSLIERAEALGEPPEDPLLLFSVLHSFFTASFVAFNGDALRDLAGQYLALAEKQKATFLLVTGHALMGASLYHTGDIAGGRAHLDQAMALYEPAVHGPLATRFSHDPGFSALCQRVRALWLLGYPDAALRDAEHALTIGRGTDHAGTLMTALFHSAVLHLLVGNYTASAAQAQELAALAEKKGALSWKVAGTSWQGVVYALTGKASSAVQILTSGITELRSMGTTISIPHRLSDLARAHAELGQYDAAWRCINEAMTLTETSNERWFEADLHRIAGDLTLMSPEQDATKAEAFFERALTIARQQQAKSWELRAAMSIARLWRDQGKAR